MRKLLQQIYTWLMRAVGGYVLFFVILLLVGATRTPLPGFWHPVTLLMCSMSLVLSLAMLLHRPLPDLVTRPGGMVSGLVIGVLFALAPFLFMVPIMISVLAFEIAEPLSRSLAVSAATVQFIACGLLWWVGIALAIWNGHAPEPPPRRSYSTLDLSPMRDI